MSDEDDLMYEDPIEDEEEEEEMDFQDLDEEAVGDEAYNETQALMKRDKSYEVLSEAEISEEATKLLGSVTDILGLHPSIAGILLRHFK